VVAVSSSEARGLPSRSVYAEASMSPSTSTSRPFFRYWAANSAVLRQQVTRNQVVFSWDSPFWLVHLRVVAMLKLVTGTPVGV